MRRRLLTNNDLIDFLYIYYNKNFLFFQIIFIGVRERTRTSGHWIKSLVLYRLSYTDIFLAVGAGFEPASPISRTTPLAGERSRPLSYPTILLVRSAGFEPATYCL